MRCIEFLFNLFTKHWLGIKAEFRVSEEAVLNVRKKNHRKVVMADGCRSENLKSVNCQQSLSLEAIK
jgi:hypothetical protein